MSVFGNYARFYNLLYRDKNYRQEALFVHQLIQSYVPKSVSILELGCGTGNHAVFLAQQGYTVHGVDLSPDMLHSAEALRSQLAPEIASRLSFSPGNIQTIRLDSQFDVLISLFHVVSYQQTNQALQATLETVKAHLKPGGLFIFDCWHGPAVLSNQPTVRIKRLEDEEIMVTRIAEPVMHPNHNLVDVNYQIFIKNKSNQTIEEIKETHIMRYLFPTELALLAEKVQLEIIKSGEWMSDQEPSVESWGTYYVLAN